jgi:hypothetical protein
MWCSGSQRRKTMDANPRIVRQASLPLASLVLVLSGCAQAPVVDSTATPTKAATAASPPEPTGAAELIPLPSADNFVDEVSNEYLPMKVGNKWVYEGSGEAAGERIEVEVLPETKEILGIQATVVSDKAFVDGKLLEETVDWYAQDDQGRVWYLGEDTTSFEKPQPSKAGSWEAGVNGAKPGVVMFADGHVNQPYYQEYLAGEAEDEGIVLTQNGQVAVADQHFTDVVITQDATALDPDHIELKFYAPGVGMVMEVATSPELGRVDLVSFTEG